MKDLIESYMQGYYVLETKFVEMQIGVPLSRYGLVIDTRGSNVQVMTGVYRLCL